MPALCRHCRGTGNKVKNKVDNVPTVMEERLSFSIPKYPSVTDIHKNQCAMRICNLDQRLRTSFLEERLWRDRCRESILGRGNVYEKDQEWQRVFEVEELKEDRCGWNLMGGGDDRF